MTDSFLPEATGPYAPAEPVAAGPFPQQFGRYELRACLGRGGMGTVFLAYDTRLDIEVALKVPHPNLLAVPGVLERFYRVARAAARLPSPPGAWLPARRWNTTSTSTAFPGRCAGWSSTLPTWKRSAAPPTPTACCTFSSWR